MQQKALLLLVFTSLLSSACFKKHALNANALLQQRLCLESLELKDYERAQTHCELCLEYDSSMPECLNGIGVIALIRKDEEKAVNFFSKALRQNNDFCEARNNLGTIYFSHGDFDKASKFFDRALEINPSNADARYNSALSHFRLAQRKKAGFDIKHSIAELELAKEQINKLVALEPEYPSAYRDLGLIELSRYDLSEFQQDRQALLKSAQRAFERCLVLDTSNDGCYEGMAQVHVEFGYFDKAFAHYFLCLTHDPNNSACRKHIVMAYEKSAHAENSYQNFKNAIMHQPQNAFAYEAFCASLFERGLDREARVQCQKALSLNPDLCSAHYRLADHYVALFNADLAHDHCRRYLLCDDKSAETKLTQNRCRDILATVKAHGS